MVQLDLSADSFQRLLAPHFTGGGRPCRGRGSWADSPPGWYLGQNGDDRHDCGQLGHEPQIVGLGGVWRQQHDAHVHTRVRQQVRGTVALRVILVKSPQPVLLLYVVLDALTRTLHICARSVLHSGACQTLPAATVLEQVGTAY